MTTVLQVLVFVCALISTFSIGFYFGTEKACSIMKNSGKEKDM